MSVSILVEAVSTKDVKTRYGVKPTYSVKGADGVWYSTGFEAPPVAKGGTLVCDVEDTPYGKSVVKGTMRNGGSAPVPAPAGLSSPQKPYAAPVGKVFPIPALHGDRAIVRQNALTNAREAVMGLIAADKKIVVDSITTDSLAEKIITLARLFEAYSCGDSDLDAAKAMIAKGDK